MSAFTDAIAKEDERTCSVAQAIAQLDDESAQDFNAWLKGDLKLTDIDVWNGLQRLGHRVGKQTVGRHRRGRGECGCTL